MSSLKHSQGEVEKRSLTGVLASKAHSDALLTGQARVLELIALDGPIEATIEELCRLIENQIPSAIAGITVLDRPGQIFETAFFPSLPATFSQAIRDIAIVAPHTGSCAAAVSLNEIVTCEDLQFSSKYDKDWVDLCRGHGIKAIQSVPACSSDGTVLGTFVVGFPGSARVDSWEPEVMKLAAHLTGVALEHSRKRKQQELLIGELRHRIRNVFTIIGSIAQFTFQHYPRSSPPIQAFSGRLKALSRAHCLPDDQHDLSRLVHDILEPFRVSHSIEVFGEEVTLSLEATQAFGLALHELATNAAKYGSLSVPDGSLRVHWVIQHEDENKVFELRWVESNGPSVSPPAKFGFGTAVIERNLSQAFDARVSMDFAPDGLRCTVSAPLVARLGRLAAVADALVNRAGTV